VNFSARIALDGATRLTHFALTLEKKQAPRQGNKVSARVSTPVYIQPNTYPLVG
jgi:hypothetical protein